MQINGAPARFDRKPDRFVFLSEPLT